MLIWNSGVAMLRGNTGVTPLQTALRNNEMPLLQGAKRLRYDAYYAQIEGA
jgi:hypothetical protein